MKTCISSILYSTLVGSAFAQDGNSLTVFSPHERFISSFDFRTLEVSDGPANMEDFVGETARIIAGATPVNVVVADAASMCGDDFAAEWCQEAIQGWRDGYFEQLRNPDQARWRINPYAIEEIDGLEADWALYGGCAMSIIDLPVTNDDEMFAAPWDEFAEQVFTEQFLETINADEALREDVLKVGLFSENDDAEIASNEILYQAWRDGRLQRPAIVIGRGDCDIDVGWAVGIYTSDSVDRVWMISEGEFILCSYYNVDPWDRVQCPGGAMELEPPVTEFMYGSYYFKIRTSLGEEIVRGPFMVDSDKKFSF